MTTRSDVTGPAGITKNRAVIYTCRCGWIDLGHARPDGARALWEEIKSEKGKKSRDGSGFQVYYAQTMRSGILSASEGRAYFVARGLSVEEKESIALAIFLRVSTAFEQMQSSLPYRWATASGFSAEDLVSNLIGFYRAVRPGDNYLQMCQPVSRAAALAVWDTYGAVETNKNYSPTPYIYPCRECPSGPAGPMCTPLPPALDKIQPSPFGGHFRLWDRTQDG